jgi:HK97 family phage major capsid protein
MPTMTKNDVDKLIREVIGDELADFRKEVESNKRAFADKIIVEHKHNEPPKPEKKGNKAARFVRALAGAKGDPERAARFVKEKWNDEVMEKALLESVFESGGAIVPDEYVAEIIDLLYAQTVVRGSGAMTIPMNSGSLTMPFLASGSSAEYVGEFRNIPTSQPEFGQLQLSAKKLAALVPISNDLIRDSSPQADTVVNNDMVRQLALREDLAFIRDDGTENKPKGMRHWVKDAHVFSRSQAGSTSTLAEVIFDLGRAIRMLEDENVPILTGGWLLTPRTKWFLQTLLDGNGNRVFWDEMMQGMLFGYPFRITTQIPSNLTVNMTNDTTEIYFADFSSLVIAENTQLIIDVFEGGTYFDGSQMVSGISTDSTVIRALARHDFGARYRGKEISVIQEIDWGIE